MRRSHLGKSHMPTSLKSMFWDLSNSYSANSADEEQHIVELGCE